MFRSRDFVFAGFNDSAAWPIGTHGTTVLRNASQPLILAPASSTTLEIQVRAGAAAACCFCVVGRWLWSLTFGWCL
jgi:hypothetical protein